MASHKILDMPGTIVRANTSPTIYVKYGEGRGNGVSNQNRFSLISFYLQPGRADANCYLLLRCMLNFAFIFPFSLASSGGKNSNEG